MSLYTKTDLPNGAIRFDIASIPAPTPTAPGAGLTLTARDGVLGGLVFASPAGPRVVVFDRDRRHMRVCDSAGVPLATIAWPVGPKTNSAAQAVAVAVFGATTAPDAWARMNPLLTMLVQS